MDYANSSARVSTDLHQLGAKETVELVTRGEVSARDIAAASLARIEQYDGLVNAWVHIDAQQALARADEIDRRRAAGETLGALAGAPIGLKDIFNTIDMPTQMGSPLWKDFTPGNDARVVHYLRMADAIFPGKTVTAEFAVHAPGPTENPHRRGFIPGTSSSGSAAAVAAYMIPAALGTQTAGSIIRPASYCGVYGMKPSFGVVPRTGMLKTTDSLDTVGWFARNIDDIELLFSTIRVHGRDFPLMESAFADEKRQSPLHSDRWTIGFVKGPKWSQAPETTRAAVEGFAKRLAATPGFDVVDAVAPAEIANAHDIHERLYDRALAYYFKEEFQQHSFVSQQIYDIISRGNALTPQQYLDALEDQNRLAASVDRWLTSFDVIIDMATAGEALEGLDSVDLPDHALIWTLCRLPTISVPVLQGATGLPLGVQFVARRYNDPLLIQFVRALRDNGLAGNAVYPTPPMA